MMPTTTSLTRIYAPSPHICLSMLNLYRPIWMADGCLKRPHYRLWPCTLPLIPHYLDLVCNHHCHWVMTSPLGSSSVYRSYTENIYIAQELHGSREIHNVCALDFYLNSLGTLILGTVVDLSPSPSPTRTPGKKYASFNQSDPAMVVSMVGL